MNKIGIHYGAFVKNWLDDQFPIINKVKRLGFDLLEFGSSFLLNLSDDELNRFKDEAEKHNIDLVLSLGLSPSQDISSSDNMCQKAGLKILEDTAKAMAKMNITDCSGIIYAAWNGKKLPYEEKAFTWERSVNCMKEAAKVFEDNNIYFNVEVVNRFESFLINTCEEAKQYLADVDSQNLGILLDTFHMNIEEDSLVKAIELAGKDLRYFHVGENNRKFPGLGTMPWKIIFDSLKIIDYKGPISMEPFTIPGGEVGTAVSLYRELLDSTKAEEDMVRSLTFIRSLVS